jgi:recombination protein U
MASNGKEFENRIITELDKLQEYGVGYFIKSPTPFRSVPSGNSYKLIYSAKALCDFVGIYKGTFILMEAKSVSGASFAINRLKEHQYDQLVNIKNLGGLSYIIFNIQRYNKVVALEIGKYNEILTNLNKKSIHIDTLLE